LYTVFCCCSTTVIVAPSFIVSVRCSPLPALLSGSFPSFLSWLNLGGRSAVVGGEELSQRSQTQFLSVLSTWQTVLELSQQQSSHPVILEIYLPKILCGKGGRGDTTFSQIMAIEEKHDGTGEERERTSIDPKTLQLCFNPIFLLFQPLELFFRLL
jgi:hypothetical protein